MRSQTGVPPEAATNEVAQRVNRVDTTEAAHAHETKEYQALSPTGANGKTKKGPIPRESSRTVQEKPGMCLQASNTSLQM
ncbi:hypothetical protein EYF80_054720 [Liparis tanakae]|uniref:Uncharacterized protein n=1 Tax=Liparis tanakae TaxID=230148 RepID=A0A4Z2F1V0_9TELE|nr:hypothetical protein EYF80_054720 [Liparis tanakae]